MRFEADLIHSKMQENSKLFEPIFGLLKGLYEEENMRKMWRHLRHLQATAQCSNSFSLVKLSLDPQAENIDTHFKTKCRAF